MSDVYALFGNPITHSRSPSLHKQFAAQFGMQIDYKIIEVDSANLLGALRHFVFSGGKGANVTAPHKRAICAHVDVLSSVALQAKAVNTLKIIDKKIYGYNTDGIGFLRDMQRKNITIKHRRIKILGTGGAAHTIYNALLGCAPMHVHMLDRLQMESLSSWGCDLLINATSAGLQGRVPSIPRQLLMQGITCYDLNYGSAASPFLNYCRTKGAKKTISGEGMLVEQAAVAYNLWTDLQPSTGQISV